ncbi:putative methyltransferase DDB_G0268948 isoform X3 [Penaeus japonicus]|uniref:putative methyltransferase DDB_G0268948 isoform X3 n=1 Tax=Penaeus japonicus TaxID=27405 RepID=UPI001C715519|nr:putative methyltransferase DDB_G0268948 isoform X3 [Penaeus japonicus]XP_042871355.1 putative methyltransferase DDB_G0268948 isoform X3 [Penaeus japonicus]XP_042871356.1 putative methyltransferase DDB_G0268948 isoform X3 [Penaeus japonicus]
MANRFFEGAAHAAAYAKFRPLPPISLVERIVSFAKETQAEPLTGAADVGCGSGQSTEILSPYVKAVTGLDVSDAQVLEARKLSKHPNVSYKVSPAETLPFPDKSLSLVTSCQACHWFDMPAFYKEVDRILVPGGVLALYGYLFPKPIHKDYADDLYNLIDHLYKEQLKGYIHQGSKEVYLGKYGDEKYTLIYKDQLRDESHYVDKTATVAELTGYLTSWSGFQNFRAKNGDEAAQKILETFQDRFLKTLKVTTAPEETSIDLRFHYFLLMGRKPLE